MPVESRESAERTRSRTPPCNPQTPPSPIPWSIGRMAPQREFLRRAPPTFAGVGGYYSMARFEVALVHPSIHPSIHLPICLLFCAYCVCISGQASVFLASSSSPLVRHVSVPHAQVSSEQRVACLDAFYT